MNDYLASIYYDPSHQGSFGGASKLYKAIKREGRNDIRLTDVKSWLQSQDPYTLHRPVKRNFKRGRVIVEGPNTQFDADLSVMSSMAQYNDGVKFLLIVIDVFSRYLYVVPLKSKMGKDVVQGFDKVFKMNRPKCLRTDKGTEFTCKQTSNYFKAQGVHHFVTHNEPKANYAERVIRTLKGRMVRYFSHKQTLRYIDVLPDLVESYNDTVHSSIGRPPSQVDTNNAREVFWFQYWPKKSKHVPKKSREKTFTLTVGDYVRLTHLRKTFMREYDETYTGEVFKITHRFRRQGMQMYRVADLSDEQLSGTFYLTELEKVNVVEDHIWKVAKVIKTRKRRGQEREMLVRWLYFPEKFDSWVKESDFENL